MKKRSVVFVVKSLLISMVSQARADQVLITCKPTADVPAPTLTIQGDNEGDAYSVTFFDADGKGLYGGEGNFAKLITHGTKAVYGYYGESEFIIDETLITQPKSTGEVVKHVYGFAGVPGDAGWPESSTSFHCANFAQ